MNSISVHWMLLIGGVWYSPLQKPFGIGAFCAPVRGDQCAGIFAQARHGPANARFAVEFAQKDVVEVVVQPVVEPVEDVHEGFDVHVLHAAFLPAPFQSVFAYVIHHSFGAK